MRNPDHAPRAPYCTGCGHVFDKMHLMINHRRLHRCGGRFLPADERILWNASKEYREQWENERIKEEKSWVYRLKPESGYFYSKAREFLISAIELRKQRHIREQQSQASAG